MAGKNYQDLIVWQRSMDLVVKVYEATGLFPHEEMYGLSSQLRWASVSIPSNIADGQGRNSVNDFRRFLLISYGSLREVETQILISHRLNYLETDQVELLLAMTGDIGRLINGLINSLDRK